MFKGNFIHLTITANRHFYPFGERIHHRNTHPMQATGKLVVFVGELTTGVQFAQNKLHP
ncbi:Uncharacterised protein [Vibrio cholerae]|nr:Uncharacterised protein [Vibrio cholerae]